jgi:hypothetical protein
MASDSEPPTVFVSYSHDDQAHKDWVLTLATRLRANGIDIVLDQWNLRFGADLPRFMETGLSESRRVVVICTERYVEKANSGIGGVGYEKMILTAQLMQDVNVNRIVPVVRRNGLSQPLPLFLGARLFVDFRSDAKYEAGYASILHDLHGSSVQPCPPIGPNPFKNGAIPIGEPPLSMRPERYVSPALRGTVQFEFANNDGFFVIGSGDMAFRTRWSGASNKAVRGSRDDASMRGVALATGTRAIGDIVDASVFDTSSRVRTANLGEVLIWQNRAGFYAATKVEQATVRSHGAERDEVIFSYLIQSNGTASFVDA